MQAIPFVPMGEPRAKREARETQEFMEKLVERFAADLKSVLEQNNKCADSRYSDWVT